MKIKVLDSHPDPYLRGRTLKVKIENNKGDSYVCEGVGGGSVLIAKRHSMNYPSLVTWTTIVHFNYPFDSTGLSCENCMNQFLWFWSEELGKYIPSQNDRVVNDIEICSELADRDVRRDWDYNLNGEPTYEHQDGTCESYTDDAQDIFNLLYDDYWDMLFSYEESNEEDSDVDLSLLFSNLNHEK